MLLFGKRQYIFYKKKINMRNYLTGKERGSSQILVHNAQLQNSLRKFYIKC